jgi:sulfur-oxidizing protein SoxY
MSLELTALSRRDVLRGAGVAVVVAAVPAIAWAGPNEVAAEVKKIFGDKAVKDGKISLDVPSIAENGLVVPLSFEVESPMTDKDYVKQVHVFAEGNPVPLVAAFHFTPMMPKAAGQIRIRLAQTQNVHVYAEMANGEVYGVKKEVKVTIGGCGG